MKSRGIRHLSLKTDAQTKIAIALFVGLLSAVLWIGTVLFT